PMLRLHMTPVARRTKPTRTRATTERPRTSLLRTGDHVPRHGLVGLSRAPRAKPRAAGAGVPRDLLARCDDGLPAGGRTEGMAAARADGLPRWADAGETPVAKRVLDDPVLPRVVGDHREDASGNESVTQCRQRAGERLEFVVDGDAYRLEEPRELARPRPRTEDGADRADEGVAQLEGTVRAPSDDLVGEARRAGLIAVLAEDPDQVALVGEVEEIGGGTPVRVLASPCHSHVEHGALPERESAGGIVELMRRDAKVEHDAIERRAGQLRN